MYNQALAFAILTELDEAFPRKSQLDDLRRTLTEFSTLPEEEWRIAGAALIKLGHAKGLVVHGMDDIPGVIANMEITDEGREFLRESRRGSGEASGDTTISYRSFQGGNSTQTSRIWPQRQSRRHRLV